MSVGPDSMFFELIRGRSNVLSVDYRGFGDSTGSPSESGLIDDAQTVWNYVYETALNHGSKDPTTDMILMGHSLGTGVASGLARRLAALGEFRTLWVCRCGRVH